MTADDPATLETTPSIAVGMGGPRPGQMWARYLLTEALGAGGMGAVWAAYDRELDRHVALKVLHDELLGRASQERLRREAQAMARVSHPNVVPVFDVGEHAGRSYYTMERVRGQSVKDWLTQPRSWREVAPVFAEAARGLAAIHAAGLVHRDVKPGNILLGDDGRARIADLGIAMSAAHVVELALSSTTTLRAAGTPAYMAPEQLRGEAGEAASDQFAFGITLWEALHGRAPFDGDTPPARLEAMKRGPRGARDLPGWLDAVARRALQLDPAVRFPDVASLAQALAGPRTRRGPRYAVAGAAAAVALTIVASARVVSCAHRGPAAEASPAARTYQRPRRITFGGDVGPGTALSPDGAAVAFSTRQALVVQPLAQEGQPRVLYQGRTGDALPAWAPDGGAIAVVVTPPGDAPPRQILVDVETGRSRDLGEARGMIALVGDGELATLPMFGNELVYWSLQAPERALRRCPLPGSFTRARRLQYLPASDALFVQLDHGDRLSSYVRIDRACRTRVVAGPMPALSFGLRRSDGRVFARRMFTHDLVAIDDDGQPGSRHVVQSDEYELVSIGADDSIVHLNTGDDSLLFELGPDGARTDVLAGNSLTSFALSPDGQVLAYIDGVYRAGLLRVGAVDESIARAAPIVTDAVLAAWSPDGGRLAVLLQIPDGYELAVWDRQTGVMSPRRRLAVQYATELLWLDAHRIGFAHVDRSGYTWIDADQDEGGQVLTEPFGEGMRVGLTRAHRREALAFLSLNGGVARVWTWSPAGVAPPTAIAMIAIAPGSDEHALAVAWSDDDESLVVYARETGDRWRVRLGDGAVETLPAVELPRRGHARVEAIFWGGGRLLVHTLRPTGDLYISDPETR